MEFKQWNLWNSLALSFFIAPYLSPVAHCPLIYFTCATIACSPSLPIAYLPLLIRATTLHFNGSTEPYMILSFPHMELMLATLHFTRMGTIHFPTLCAHR